MGRQFVTLDVGRIAYAAEGQGPALLLLHSNGFSADAWGKVLGHLAQSHAVYALDMLGHGYSDKPPRNFMVEDYAQSTISFMDKLELDKVILCGNSIGALISLEMAITHPQRVEKLMLVGSPGRNAWERAEQMAQFAHRFDAEGNPKPLSVTDLANWAHPTPQLVEWINQQRAMAGIWVKKGLIAITLYDVLAKLPLVRCPTLVLYGSQDPSGEKAKNLVEGIKGAKHALVKDAGHLPQVEQPKAFLQEINQFLSSP